MFIASIARPRHVQILTTVAAGNNDAPLSVLYLFSVYFTTLFQ
jgi:hypothetical protein